MPKKASLLFMCLAAAGFAQVGPATNESEPPAVMHAYLVGNSLVRSITPTRLHQLMADAGIDFQFGSQLKGGFGLAQHWAALEQGTRLRYWESNKRVNNHFEPGRPDGDTLPKRFGSYWTAHKDHEWDALVLQPNLGRGREKELEAFRKFVTYSIEHKSARQIYVYTSWLRRPVLRDATGKFSGLGDLDFQEIWEGRSAGQASTHVVRKDYLEFINTVNQEFAGKLGQSILMIPFGDVVCELDERLKAGRIPGLEELHRRDPKRIPNWDPQLKSRAGANILYADRSHPVVAPHLDGTIANYVMGLMFYAVLTGNSPVGLSGEPYELGDEADAELRGALQRTVWDVVSNHPHTGLTPAQKLRAGSLSSAR
ncbi:MAG: hypothetical protein GY953_25100 [bacterium]|nr:hypothetical protein [bacterium]